MIPPQSAAEVAESCSALRMHADEVARHAEGRLDFCEVAAACSAMQRALGLLDCCSPGQQPASEQ